MTAKKKTLIELMLDAGVTPEDINGDFIVCDKTRTDESCAYDQASSGKGQERHGQDLPFTKQPMQLIQDLCGEGFALGQAMKKMQESQRLPHDAAIRELLGAINYIAGAIIHKEKLQGSK